MFQNFFKNKNKKIYKATFKLTGLLRLQIVEKTKAGIEHELEISKYQGY